MALPLYVRAGPHGVPAGLMCSAIAMICLVQGLYLTTRPGQRQGRGERHA